MYRILISDPMSEQGLLPFKEDSRFQLTQMSVEEVINLDQFDGLIVRSGTMVDESLLEKMSQLKIIARAGVGIDNIDLAVATKKGIIVVNAPNGNTISTAEHTFAMIASLVRKIPQANYSLKTGEWNRKAFNGVELYQKSLGILGLGRIGSELAKRAKVFGINVHVFDPYLTTSRAEKLGVEKVSFDELLRSSDIITIHTPLTKDTRYLLNRETLSQTKKGVYIINCARGGIIDEGALYESIVNGQVAGAAIDVFETEPPMNNCLLQLDQVIATPHIAASTKEAQFNVAEQVVKEVKDFFNGKPVGSSLNLPAISEESFKSIESYYKLCYTIGSFLSQCMREPVHTIEVNYLGETVNLESDILTRRLLSGFFRERIGAIVNDVNSGIIANERGISYSQKITKNTKQYANSIEVSIIGEQTEIHLQATCSPEFGERIVKLNHYPIDVQPNGHLLYISHKDRPGVIGRVGNILGNDAINIATMHVGRKELGGDAIMILSIDKPVDKSTDQALLSIDDITSIRKIFL